MIEVTIFLLVWQGVLLSIDTFKLLKRPTVERNSTPKTVGTTGAANKVNKSKVGKR